MAKKKYIETPDKMWQLFLDYAEHTKDHPITVKDFIGPKAITVHRELQKAIDNGRIRKLCGKRRTE
jgi:hypothetical protein